MKKTNVILICMTALLLLPSCTKEKGPIVKSGYDPNVAPCEVTETVYFLDSIFYTPSNYFPEAKFRIKFADAVNTGHKIEFAFNKIPVTGMYRMVTYIDTNVNYDQMASISDSGSYSTRSAPTEYPEVYIENNAGEFIISFCNISNLNPTFDANTLTYIGNYVSDLKVRKHY